MSIKHTLTLLAFFCSSALVSAQSRLQTAIETYQRIHQQYEAMAAGTITESDLAILQQTVAAQTAQLDSFLMRASGSDALTAQYFNGLYQYELASVFEKTGATVRADSLYKIAERKLSAFDSSRFPLEYNLGGTSYQIQFGDFGPIMAELNAQVARSYFNAQQFDTALPYARKADFSGYLTHLSKVLNSYRLTKMFRSVQEFEEARFDAAMLGVEEYNDLSPDQKKAALAIYPDLLDWNTNVINDVIQSNKDYAEAGSTWATLSRVFLRDQQEPKAIAMADSAVLYGCDEREFLLSSIPIALKNNRKDLALTMTNRFAEGLNDQECGMLDNAVHLYEQLDDPVKAAQMQAKAVDCQKAAKNISNPTSVNRRDAGFYVGTYVLPWFRTDWGVVGAIQTRRHFFEVSYQQLSDRKDRRYDLRLRGVDGAADFPARWDGYYTHLSINKLQGKTGRRAYSGVLFGYNERNFQTISEPSITDASGQIVNDGAPVDFNPQEKRYIVMLNGGTHQYGRILASNWFFSVGGAWCEFDAGNDNYDRDTYNFSNPLLQGRKDSRFVFMARFGVTVGLHVGPKTWRKRN
jgi:hypothetical protein